MLRESKWIIRLQTVVGLSATVALISAASGLIAARADSTEGKQAEAPKAASPPTASQADAVTTPKVAVKEGGKATPKAAAKPVAKAKKLSGSELYAIHCNRCHPERYPTEFTAPQWKTIGTHMRVRANLPAVQIKEIIKYLQEEAGS